MSFKGSLSDQIWANLFEEEFSSSRDCVDMPKFSKSKDLYKYAHRMYFNTRSILRNTISPIFPETEHIRDVMDRKLMGPSCGIFELECLYKNLMVFPTDLTDKHSFFNARCQDFGIPILV